MSVPDPLTPAEADLQDFPFMPLHVARLRDSDLAAEGNPEGCWYAVLLWAASWHQLPAGSLPAGDTVLARLCGLGRDVKTFGKHRADAMRGWIECSDGRLYHPVVAEQVNAAWAEKLAYRSRRAARKAIAEKAAAARWSNSTDDQDANAQGMHDALHEASSEHASCIDDAMPKGTGRGRGRGTGNIIDDPNGSLSETSSDPVISDDPDPGLKPQHIIDEWNKIADARGLPKVKALTGTRLRQLHARIREHSLEDWMDAFNAIERNPWMHGENDRGWRADFDFLLQPSSFQKLIEGSYDRSQSIQRS